MREYGQVQCAFWGHPDIVGLSDEAKLLAIYLLTSPNSNGLGCYRLPLGYAQEDLGWSLETLLKGFQELFESGFCKHCETTRYVLIPAFLRWNPITNANVAKARVKEFDEVPKQFQYLSELAVNMQQHGQHWPEGFRNRLETLSKGVQNRPETGSNSRARPDPDPDPDPDPEPEPEPDPDITTLRASANGAGRRFDEFWSLYPKHREKKRAREIWLRKRLDQKADAILEDIRQRPTRDRRWMEGYIPDPCTYLNRERWEDEYEAPDSGPQKGATLTPTGPRRWLERYQDGEPQTEDDHAKH